MYIHVGGKLQLLVLNVHRGVETLSQLHVFLTLLILRSSWGLSSPGKQVGKSSSSCRKRSQVRGRESEQWPKYMQ